MRLVINGKEREFPSLPATPTVTDLIGALDLKGDRVALEHNGEIVRRDSWPATPIRSGDKFEIVHFVGGGSALGCEIGSVPGTAILSAAAKACLLHRDMK